jgi:hypothetical protein
MTRFFDEVLNGARFDASTLESLFTDMVLVHGALENPAARLVGREALRAFLQRLRRALPEAQFALEDVGGEGDFVLADWKARVCSSFRPMTPAWLSLSAPPQALAGYGNQKFQEIWFYWSVSSLAMLFPPPASSDT